MSERIQQLEDALRSTNSKVAPTEHPLLRQELLLIKKSPELFGIDQQMMVHDTTPERRTEDHPRTSPAASSKDGEEVRPPSHAFPGSVPAAHPRFAAQYATTSNNTPVGQHYHARQSEISPELARLSRSFPSPWSICFELDLDMRQRLRDMLPRREDAEHLCEQARRNAFWQ